MIRLQTSNSVKYLIELAIENNSYSPEGRLCSS
ncbi:hypothetical protein T06_15184 [Trichinella sp. T6]|nr:hypothetical protein T06_15184 [Trichinella sp. T6]